MPMSRRRVRSISEVVRSREATGVPKMEARLSRELGMDLLRAEASSPTDSVDDWGEGGGASAAAQPPAAFLSPSA
eukprot:1619974-Pyramimonas_sp.AAC.1